MLERTAVYTDTYRYAGNAARLGDRAHTLVVSDISGIYAYLVSACRDRLERGTIIKMNIGNERNCHAVLMQIREYSRICRSRNGHANYLRTRSLEAAALEKRHAPRSSVGTLSIV